MAVRIAMVAVASATNEIEKVAQQVLPWDDLEVVRGVPVFMEHTTRSKDGDPISWTKEDLQRLCSSQNARCLKGMFAPISRGHTVSEGQQPEVVGFSGNCRLQQIGDKWGVVCDEYRFKSDREWFKRNPRRSPEVWDHKDRTRSFFDPIAALGAETPRLDMPMRFSRRYGGRTVELYSGVPVSVESSPEHYAATYAAGPTTHVPQQTREKYQMDGDIQEIAKAVFAMIRESDEWKSLQGSQDVPVGAPTEPPPLEEPVMDPMMEGGPSEMEMAGGAPPAAPPAVPPAAPPTEEEPEEYMGMGSMPYSREAFNRIRTERDATAEKYARLQRDHENVVKKYQAASKELETLRSEHSTIIRDKTDARREKELYSLRNERVFDLDGEENGLLKRCLYSRGSDMSDAEFDRTIANIREWAPESPEGAPRLPVGVGEEPPAPRPAAPERYSREVREAAKVHVQEQRATGKSISFDQACQYIAKQQEAA